jgi:hypothetical protein
MVADVYVKAIIISCPSSNETTRLLGIIWNVASLIETSSEKPYLQM